MTEEEIDMLLKEKEERRRLRAEARELRAKEKAEQDVAVTGSGEADVMGQRQGRRLQQHSGCSDRVVGHDSRAGGGISHDDGQAHAGSTEGVGQAGRAR
jgi:hypothetical protein